MGYENCGRKSNRDEAKRLRILERAWDLVDIQLQKSDTKSMQLAGQMVLKDITTRIEGKGIGTSQYIILRNAKQDQDQNAQLPARQVPV